MENAQNSSQYRSLALDIDSASIGFLIYGGNEDFKTGTIMLDSSLSDYRQALENAVYDNAQLLNDYANITIAIHSQHFALLPQELADKGLSEKILAASFTTLEGDVLCHPIAGSDAAVACDLPSGVLGFLRRTFANATIMHHLVPLCNYCLRAYAEDTACLHISINEDEAHIVVVKQGLLQMANTFQFRALEDVAYYALNMWKTCGLDASRDKVLLSGNNQLRRELAEQLRQWIAYVMPEVLPAEALQLGRDAINLPFNLITLASC